MVKKEAFLGRTRELAVLQELADSGRPELFVLYGRRRVGKTELLHKGAPPFSGRRGEVLGRVN